MLAMPPLTQLPPSTVTQSLFQEGQQQFGSDTGQLPRVTHQGSSAGQLQFGSVLGQVSGSPVTQLGSVQGQLQLGSLTGQSPRLMQ